MTIEILAVVLAAGQLPPHPYKIDQAVVVADVLKVGVPRGVRCENTPQSICITGVPNVVRMNVRKVLYGKASKGMISVLAGAPVQIQSGRNILLMQGGDPDWLVTAVAHSHAPCFEAEEIYPENSADPVFRRIGDQLCVTSRP